MYRVYSEAKSGYKFFLGQYETEKEANEMIEYWKDRDAYLHFEGRWKYTVEACNG